MAIVAWSCLVWGDLQAKSPRQPASEIVDIASVIEHLLAREPESLEGLTNNVEQTLVARGHLKPGAWEKIEVSLGGRLIAAVTPRGVAVLLLKGTNKEAGFGEFSYWRSFSATTIEKLRHEQKDKTMK